MKTFDLNMVQQETRKQIRAGNELLDLIDRLLKVRDLVPEGQRAEFDKTLEELVHVSGEVVDSAGRVSRSITRFLTQ